MDGQGQAFTKHSFMRSPERHRATLGGQIQSDDEPIRAETGCFGEIKRKDTPDPRTRSKPRLTR